MVVIVEMTSGTHLMELHGHKQQVVQDGLLKQPHFSRFRQQNVGDGWIRW